jgi:hypothetical protein
MAHAETTPRSDKEDADALSPLPRTDQRLIIRLWVDDTTAGGSHRRWYGQIVNITGGEPRYVRRLSEISDIVVSVLEGMGVRLPWSNRVISWLRHVDR